MQICLYICKYAYMYTQYVYNMYIIIYVYIRIGFVFLRTVSKGLEFL